MATIALEQRNLVVRTDYTHKDVCKAIPGARWSADLRAWVYPASAVTADELRSAFPAAAWDDAATQLLATADRHAKTGQGAKTQDEATLAPIPLTKTTPWPHQVRAYHFAKDLPGVMFDMGMGTGKSKISTDLIGNHGWSRTLILCPNSVVAVWPVEFDRHAAVPARVVNLKAGTVSDRVERLRQEWALADVQKCPLVAVLNYEAAWREPMASALLAMDWCGVVFDEIHRIKAPGGKAAMFCSRLGDRVPRRVGLTGTPMPHSPLDVYAEYRAIDKGIFGTSFTRFRARYAVMGGYGNHQVTGYQHQDELRERMSRITFRVTSEEVQQLPDTIDTVIPTPLGKTAHRHYTQLSADFVTDCEAGRVTASNALTRLLRMQQLTGGCLKLDRNIETGEEGETQQVDDAKQSALVDLFTDANEPVVVFCRFHHDLSAVREAAEAAGRTSLELSGRVNQLADWQAGNADVLAVQIASGSVGIDLTRAALAVFYSLGFSLGEYLQARKRVHRPGQARRVRYYHLIAPHTIDQQIYDALSARQDVVSSILDRPRGA